MTRTERRLRRRPLAALLMAGAATALAGCEKAKSPSVFDDITRMPTREELVEVALGTFTVPVPIILESASNRFEPANLMQVELDLFAVVDPDQAWQVERLKERNEGRLRDSVIRVCRTTTRDDLMEAQKATLKAHLLDAVQPLLGGAAVRRLGLQRVVLDEL